MSPPHSHDWRTDQVVVTWNDGRLGRIVYKYCRNCGKVLT